MPRLPDLPDLPDFLGTAARVESVSNLLEEAQAQLQHFENTRVVNGHAPTDAVVGTGDPTLTYQKRAKQLIDGIRALMKANEDIADELTAEAVKRRRARERAREQDDGLRRYATTPAP